MVVSVEFARGAGAAADRDFVASRIAQSVRVGERFFTEHANAIAGCAAAMADRFFAGATLFVFGSGPHTTDAQHNSVEYVHPVLPGCRALPALSLTNDTATVIGMVLGDDALDVFAHQLRVLGRPGDIALGFAHAPQHPSIVRGLEAGAAAGMLTVSLTSGEPGPVDAASAFAFHVDGDDRGVAHEVHLATYHMLWELVHIVLNHRGIGEVQ
ncbi:MAG TPA: SIS domain-containing protein [Candidatus Dormibacteraeota bacterium]